MKDLILPVPETVSATYAVPVPVPMSTIEARRRASEAVQARLGGPLRTVTAEWLATDAVEIKAEPTGTPSPPGLLDKPLFGTPEQRAFLARARAFIRFSATQRTSLVGMQEWKARGPAGALAASLGAPVLDMQAGLVLTAEDALAALPSTALSTPPGSSGEVSIGLEFKPWVRVHDVGHPGVIAVMTDGMRRFGLPEFRLAPASPDLRYELKMLLNGTAFRFWFLLLARAQQTPNAAGLLSLPPFLRVPAQMDIHRRDLDWASGARNRGGTGIVIGLRFDPPQGGEPWNWLTVCPPADWDMGWEDFIANACHAMFGFEKPRWHYIPEFGALLDATSQAMQTLPEARSRFLSGDLPPGGRLMVRHKAAGTDEYRWSQVESWETTGHAVVRDVGRELASGVRPGPPVTIETSQVVDWGIWVDGRGVVEGAGTEGVGHHLS
jgi:hypothetical protein